MTFKQLLTYFAESVQFAEHETQQEQLGYLEQHYNSDGELKEHLSGESDILLRDHFPLHHRKVRLAMRVPIVRHADDPHSVEVDLCAGRSKNFIDLEIEYAPHEHTPEGIALLKESHINKTRK